MNCQQDPLCLKHVELICRSTSVLRDEIQTIKPVKTSLEAFLCFKLTNGVCYKSQVLMTLPLPVHHHPQRVR